jgi:hypothetical protein
MRDFIFCVRGNIRARQRHMRGAMPEPNAEDYHEMQWKAWRQSVTHSSRNPEHQTSNPLIPNLRAKTQLLKPNPKVETSNSKLQTLYLESQTPKPNAQTQTPRPLPCSLLVITTAQRGRLQVRRQRHDHAGSQSLTRDVHLAAVLRCEFFYSRISEAMLLLCSRRLTWQSPQSLCCLRPAPGCSARVHV